MSTSHTAPRITICGIPELGEHYAAGVTHVLSILGPTTPDPPELAAFAPHQRLILRFNGEIAAAVGAIYARILARDPGFVDQMIGAGRDREVSAAYREVG